MSTIDTPKRIIVDEYPQEDRETIEKLAIPLNYFMEQVTNTINGRLDFENLNRQAVVITVVTDGTGAPIRQTQFSANNGLLGINVLRAVNTRNPVNFPLNAPFVSFSSNGQGIYTIQHVTGLRSGEDYQLTLELVF